MMTMNQKKTTLRSIKNQLRPEMPSFFLGNTKERFKNEPTAYQTFVDMIAKFMAGDISQVDISKYILELFRDHPDLLEEFERFLPPNCKVACSSIDDEEFVQRMEENRIRQKHLSKAAAMFVEKMMSQFEASSSSDVIQSFADVVRRYYSIELSEEELVEEATKILEGHAGLMDSLKACLSSA